MSFYKNKIKTVVIVRKPPDESSSRHILHKNHAGFFGALFFSVTETDETIKIYKEYSKMD